MGGAAEGSGPSDVGRRIGPYEVLEELARGGAGVVYRARDPRAGREVALKLLPAAAGPGSVGWRRFEREAAALARLDHPGIVRVHEFGRDEGRPYLAMELIRGVTLQERLETGGPFPPAEAARLVAELARAAAHAHDQGLLHRDVKPDNVLIDGEGACRLVDFGLARDLDVERSRLTGTGVFAGTPGYWAPEQARGRSGELGPGADVYGLGATLYALLTGGPPFGGTLVQALMAVTSEDPAPPSTRRPGLDPALDAICLRCLAKEPGERYPGARALADALSRWAARGAGETGQGRAAGGTGRGRAIAGGIVALGLAAAAGVVALAAGPGDAPGGPPETPSPRAAATPTPTPAAAEPAWLAALPRERRPPLPLPAGLTPAGEPGVYRHEADGSLLVWVPPGRFTMGLDDGGLGDEAPAHPVALARGFYLGRREVTWRQFRLFCAETGRAWPSPLIERDGVHRAGPDEPVFNVTAADALAYCAWAGLRLPSEAEWEWAARGPDGRRYPWGPDPGADRLNAGRWRPGYEGPWIDDRDGYAWTAPVGSFPEGASPFGCLDMAGNVWEWVADPYVPHYRGAPDDGSVWRPAGADGHVHRGGSWDDDPALCVTTTRWGAEPGYRDIDVGFRVAR